MGMKTRKCPISLENKSDHELSMALYTFCNCFNIHNFTAERSHFKVVDAGQNPIHVDEGTVQRLFWGVKERKSPGPYGVGGRILKNCIEQLSDIFSYKVLNKVPRLWKDSIIVPVSKTKAPKHLNDWPVALTLLVMKTLEKNSQKRTFNQN